MRSKILTVLLALVVLVLAGNTVSQAATGHGLLLGRANSATKATGITRTTPGSALALKTKKSTDAPLAVNGTGKVVHLNADKVDGKDASALGTRALVWSWTGSTSATNELKFLTGTLPAGSYLVNYEVFLGTGAYPSHGPLDCYVRRNNDNVYLAEGGTDGHDQWGTSLNGSGIVTLTKAGYLRLDCRTDAATTWATDDLQPVRIAAVPIDTLTAKGAPTLG